jgi:DNA repair protein SbcC/Rad50
MIVTRLRVHPFGFFSDREIRFAPGLNVVLGPNEAGKSTIFSAIRSSLLRARLRKPEFDKLMARFLPAGGGDIARLELEFLTSEGEWLLKRQWGVDARSELKLPGGGVLADDEAIKEKLLTALPARQGTFWKVLMTGQAELARTLESLRSDGGGTVSDFTDMLRRTVLETGGVPIDAFRGLLAGRLKDTFQHWDDVHKGPEAGRGIEKPWKKEVGTILAAWYAREEIKARHTAAVAYETALDAVNGRLRAAAQSAAEADAFLAANRKAAQDAPRRQTLEARAAAIRHEQRELHAVNHEWPGAEARARDIQGRLEEIARSRAPLEEEVREARAQEEGRLLREKHGRVQRRRARLQEARALAQSVPPLPRKDLEELRRLEQTAMVLRAGREAGKLTMSITAHADISVTLQEDLGPQETRRIGQGETLELRAGGSLRLAFPPLDVEVRSGDAGAARQEEAARGALEKLLARLGVTGVDEAEERARTAEMHEAAVRAAENNLAEELGGQPEEELERRVAALGPARSTRPLAECSAELARLHAETEALNRELKGISAQVDAWTRQYENRESVVNRLADARLREQEIALALEGCAPVPPGFTDAESFLRAYEAARDESKRRAEESARYADEKRDLEKRGPDQSSEELAQLLHGATEDLNAALAAGRALKRISVVTDELLGRSDTAVIDGMRAALEPLIQAMSRGRHAGVALDGSLPRGLTDSSGRVLGWELLSGGTRDMLALALRLAMASFFLRDTDGFLMLDDPLSEMDPDRQKAAAAALRSFARDRQLIAFTCHPASAEMMGGNLICL